MDSKKLACALIALGMAYGCSSTPTFTFPPRDETCADPTAVPCATNVPVADTARTVEIVETFPDRTLTYVLSTIQLPEATPDPDGPEGPLRSRAAGFNVDGQDSGPGSTDLEANCEEFNQDFISVTDANHVGVDNALQGLVGTIEGLLSAEDCPGMMTAGCLDANLQEQIESGSLLLMIQVTGVNDFMYDSNVTMQMHLGELPAGVEVPMVASGGGLAAGQTFTGMAIGTAVPGDIFNGRLRAATDLLPLTIDAGGFVLVLNITQAQVRFNITEGTLSEGAIGGVVTVDAIVEAAAVAMPGIEETVRSIVESVADVTPGAEDPAVCEAVSLGLTFTGVDATISN